MVNSPILLSSSGVPNTLQTPVIILKEGQTEIATNDNWQTNNNASATSATGVPPSDSREAALYIRLESGAYTVSLGGVGGTMGNGLIEVFEVD